MQKTNILIAATQEESGVERLEISDFIRCLNECCVDKGHFFTLVYDDVSKSAERPDYDCAKFNLAFFLFSGAADARLQEVYNRAIASYNLSGMPVIALNEHSERDIRAGIEQRPDDFPRSTMHYIRSYSHVDTLKLGILMQIKQIGLSYVDIRLENGRAWQGNEALLRLDNVDAVRGYEHLQSLKSDFLLLDYEFNAAKAHYEDNPDDGDAYDAFFDASVRRNEASREIQDIEMQLFHMIEGMYEHTTRGNLSKRRTEGYRLVERGFLSEAREVLDFDAIVRESRSDSDDDGEDSAAVRALAHISEQMQLKDVNASLLDWDAVDACYREAMRLEEWFNLPRKATLEYVDFLSDQNRFAECVAVAEVLRSYYGRAMGQASAGERAQLLRLLGLSYLEIKRFADGESCCKEAVEVASGAGGAGSAEAAGAAGAEGGTGAAATESGTRAAGAEGGTGAAGAEGGTEVAATEGGAEAMSTPGVASGAGGTEAMSTPVFEGGGRAPDSVLADCYRSLAYFYIQANRHADAEAVVLKALELFRGLNENASSAYEIEIAKLMQNLSAVYLNTGRMEEAEEMLLGMVETYKKASASGPETFDNTLAMAYNNLGLIYDSSHRFEEAERMQKAALELRKKMTAKNPDAYERWVVTSYANLCNTYVHSGRLAEAVEINEAGLVIQERLAKRDPDTHEDILATMYNNQGVIYYYMQHYEEAERMVYKNIEIVRRLNERGSGVYDESLAGTYLLLGVIYLDSKRMGEAENMLTVSMEYQLKAEAEGKVSMLTFSADIYFYIAKLFHDTGRTAEAFEACRTALQKFDEFMPISPEECSELARKTQSLLDDMEREEAEDGVQAEPLTPEEREIAMMLMDGNSRSDILRKQHLSAAEVSEHESSIRKKILRGGAYEPQIAAIASEFKLTKREAEILRYLRRDYPNVAIAEVLSISVETVKVHVRNLLKKLPVESRAEISVWVRSFE